MILKKELLRHCTAEQNFVVNLSVNYAQLVEFKYFELIYYLMGQYLLQTGAGISKWGNFITKKGGFALLQSEAKAITKSGRYFTKKWQSLLQSGADTTKRDNFITKLGRYYIMEQLFQSRAVHRPKVHQGVYQKNLLPSPFRLICLLDTRTNGGTSLRLRVVFYNMLKWASKATSHF